MSIGSRAVAPVYSGCGWVNLYQDWDTHLMTAICQAESRGNPNAINTHNTDGVDDFGLLQLHGQDILNPAQNITAGHNIWLRQGYTAWTSYNNGTYLFY